MFMPKDESPYLKPDSHHFMGYNHDPLSGMPSGGQTPHHQQDMMPHLLDLSKQESNPYLHNVNNNQVPNVLPNQDPLSFLALSQQNSSIYNQNPVGNTFNYSKEGPVSMLDMSNNGQGSLLLNDDAERVYNYLFLCH